MKKAGWFRTGLVVSAALSAIAVSPAAFAQPVGGDPQYCEELAWATCNPDLGPWNPYKYRCWNETYEACLAGEPGPYASLTGRDAGRQATELAAAVARAMSINSVSATA